MKKKIFSVWLAIMAGMMMVNATVYSGSCGVEGDNVVWQLNTDNGVLTISGNGAMADYTYNAYDAPWQSYKSYVTSVIINYGVTTIGTYAFQQCTSIKNVTIPNSVTVLGHGAFKNCSSLIHVTIPESVERLTNGGTTFQHCTSMQSVIWNAISCVLEQHNSSTYYPPFLNLSNITTFILGEKVQVIPRHLCQGLTGLASLEIPESVKEIGSAAFKNCTGLTTVFCKAVTPPTLDEDVFLSVDQSTCKLYVPYKSIDAYKSANQWKDFTNILAIPGTETEDSEPEEMNCNIRYMDKNSELVSSEQLTFHVPEAPVFDGFTFLRWEFVGGVMSEGLTIQAVYEADEPTSAPAVVSSPANPAQKLIRNGNVYILKDEKTYTIQGHEVK